MLSMSILYQSGGLGDPVTVCVLRNVRLKGRKCSGHIKLGDFLKQIGTHVVHFTGFFLVRIRWTYVQQEKQNRTVPAVFATGDDENMHSVGDCNSVRITYVRIYN